MGYSLFLLVILYSFVYSSTAEKYRGAVVGYSPIVDSSSVEIRFQKNVANYVDIIKSMQNKADILIFPEYGLSTLYPKVGITVKNHLYDYAMIIGDIGYNPCKKPVEGKSRDNNLIALSCAVNTSGLHVFFNVIEVDVMSKVNDTYYFTDVVFNANGEIILKCQRNISLNGSGGFDILPASNPCTFDAKFNNNRVVTFNILHKEDMTKRSHKNLNFIAPSLLLDSLPLDYGASLWSGFSANNEANVLVPKYFDSTIKSGAYGISHFDGNGVRGNFSVGLNGRYDVIIQDVPLVKKKTEDTLVEVTAVKKIENIMYNNLTVMDNVNKTSKQYLNTKRGQTVCCTLEAELDKNYIDPYRWVATLEHTTYLGQDVFLVRCALIKPTENTSNLKFKSVSVTVQVDDNIINQVIPSAVTVEGSIPKYIYKRTDKDTSMVLSSNTGEILIGFGMVVILDSTMVSSAACNDVSMILMTIVAVVVKYWY